MKYFTVMWVACIFNILLVPVQYAIADGTISLVLFVLSLLFLVIIVFTAVKSVLLAKNGNLF